MRVFNALVTGALALNGCHAISRHQQPILYIRDDLNQQGPLQTIVKWDNSSLFINGERLMIYSGEFHPFRLPVPSLWLDVFQKIRALGLNTVSFYVHWAQLEGKPGEFIAQGIFDYAAFFDAATEAGVYLIARPGPYINAEVSGGGFPGWLQRINGTLRNDDVDYLRATDNYMANIGSIISKAQITHGGPVILYQPENEYTHGNGAVGFPNGAYMQYVVDQARKAGIVVPLISNDASAVGNNAPGTGEGEVDIYGHDGYPLGFDCRNPSIWPAGALPTTWRAQHMNSSASTPYTIPEFQGGSFDPWGGPGFINCEKLLNHEHVRVFYKNNYSFGVSIYSVYMAIAEDRTVAREKYSELKLEASFLRVSPGYLTATPSLTNLTGIYSPNRDITVTPLIGVNGSFFVVRHTEYQLTESTPYTLTLPTSLGPITLPSLGGDLTLGPRDTKFHVTDYPVGDWLLLYSTAEIFTWQKFGDKTVLILYGGLGEHHEIAVKVPPGSTSTFTAQGIAARMIGDTALAWQWVTAAERQLIRFQNLHIYLVDRNSAYNYWAPAVSGTSSSIIVKGGYLVRRASVNETTLSLTADFNRTTAIEVIGVPNGVTAFNINGAKAEHTVSSEGNWIATVPYLPPTLHLPDLTTLAWQCIDSLPEIQASYDDAAWVDANLTATNNTRAQPLLTPVVLYGSDYGFHTGALLFRGYFTAAGPEKQLYIETQGGSAFASSVWLNNTFIGSWAGNASTYRHEDVYVLPNLTKGERYVFTVLVDNMGLDENWVVGNDWMKAGRGILNYRLSDQLNASTPVSTWKITGNLGGESYADRFRGPLNEGGLFIERQGYHLPSPPVDSFVPGSPLAGLPGPGLAYFTAKFVLSLPADQWDIPLSVEFEPGGDKYRAWLYVNGFQYGRYVSHIGPQINFPVPEGILNYTGDNWIGLVIWATEKLGSRFRGLTLKAGTPALTGREAVRVVEGPLWARRPGAY